MKKFYKNKISNFNNINKNLKKYEYKRNYH